MKKKSIRRMLSMITGVAVLATIIPASVMADTGVQYVDSYGETSTCTKYTTVDASDHEWTTGWYVVENGTDNKIAIQDRIEINGSVNLILDDTIQFWALDGFHVGPNSSLTIYGRSINLEEGPGSNLVARTKPENKTVTGYAAIGGNAGEKNGKISIVSGRVSAESQSVDGAGIGTGNYSSRDAFKNDATIDGDVNIFKAFVYCVGGHNAAGIGGGDYADSAYITVKGGKVRVNANGNHQVNKADDSLIGAAGIGGGRGGFLTAFGMTDGEVIAMSDGIGPGIGDGYDASRISLHNRTIVIMGGSLVAISNWGTSALMGALGQDMSVYYDEPDEHANVQLVRYDNALIKYADCCEWPDDSCPLHITQDINEYKNHNLISISPCPHEEHVYQATAGTHIEKCTTCRTVFSKENHDLDSHNRCSVCGYEAPVVFNVRAQLTGKITIVYLFRLSEDLKKDENAYVSFTSSGKTWTQKFADMFYDSPDNAFGSFVHVDAMNLADSIVINVYNGNNEKQTLISQSCTDYTEEGFSYSIKDYSEHMFSNPDYQDFAEAIYNYGAMVYEYFRDSDDWQPDMNALNAVTEEKLTQFAIQTNGKENRPAGISKTTIVVSFDSDNTLRITYYLNNASDIENLTFTLDGQPYTPKKLSDKAYAIDVENIAAPDLDVPHTFVVSDSVKTYTIEASAMSYALTSIKSGNDKRANLGKAFYLYNQAANTFFATQSN